MVVVAGFSLLISICGALLMYLGEWIERSKLPPEMQTPEAIQKYYDGAVCLACDFGGGILILTGISSAITVLLAWSLMELGGTSKALDRDR